MKAKKTTKIEQIKSHLINKGKINTWEAIELYGATRLSGIIFKLKEYGYEIESINKTKKDRNGNVCNFVDYVFKSNNEILLN